MQEPRRCLNNILLRKYPVSIGTYVGRYINYVLYGVNMSAEPRPVSIELRIHTILDLIFNVMQFLQSMHCFFDEFNIIRQIKES